MTDEHLGMSRRNFAALAAMAAAGVAVSARAQSASEPHGDAKHQSYMERLRPLTFGIVMFPGMTALDMIAPQLIMANMMKSEVHLVAKSMEPVVADSGVAIVPTKTFAQCPRGLDALLVPGGPRGTQESLSDDQLLDFVADRGASARYVTSVCTGSVILGAAGLLQGYRAASHWMTRDMLPLFGAIPVEERVVVDRNRMTGGGITAGIDFGLRLMALLRDEELARVEELLIEYDPEPPYRSGSMRTAQPETIRIAQSIVSQNRARIQAAAEQARRRRFT